MSVTASPRRVGNYAIFDAIATGGMATVHYGRQLGEAGFSRTVAVKALHPQFAADPSFATMLVDEARLSSRIRHPIELVDVVRDGAELLLVLAYVAGEPLHRLMKAARGRGGVPAAVAIAILCDMLTGLHAAHEAKDATGRSLELVHRDVSPQNVIVGEDGIARVLDFGVAKAIGRSQMTLEGQLKGKLGYMSPEQLQGCVNRRSDLFAAGVVAWEVFVGRRLFTGDDAASVLLKVLTQPIEAPSAARPGVPPEVDAPILRALERDEGARFATAEELAEALRAVISPASPREVAAWVAEVAGQGLAERAAHVRELEAVSLDARDTTPTKRPPPRSIETDPSLAANAVDVTPAPRTRRVGLAGAAAIVAASAIAVVAWRVGSAAPEAAPASAPVAHAEPPPAETQAAPPPPPPTVDVATAATATATAATSAPAPKPRPAKAPPRAAKVGCEPPFVVGPDGKKHYKPECF